MRRQRGKLGDVVRAERLATRFFDHFAAGRQAALDISTVTALSRLSPRRTLGSSTTVAWYDYWVDRAREGAEAAPVAVGHLGLLRSWVLPVMAEPSTSTACRSPSRAILDQARGSARSTRDAPPGGTSRAAPRELTRPQPGCSLARSAARLRLRARGAADARILPGNYSAALRACPPCAERFHRSGEVDAQSGAAIVVGFRGQGVAFDAEAI